MPKEWGQEAGMVGGSSGQLCSGWRRSRGGRRCWLRGVSCIGVGIGVRGREEGAKSAPAEKPTVLPGGELTVRTRTTSQALSAGGTRDRWTMLSLYSAVRLPQFGQTCQARRTGRISGREGDEVSRWPSQGNLARPGARDRCSECDSRSTPCLCAAPDLCRCWASGETERVLARSPRGVAARGWASRCLVGGGRERSPAVAREQQVAV
ncbi:hypothetical protein BJY59DRAFT_345746 [Rhodotorula toruloides]